MGEFKVKKNPFALLAFACSLIGTALLIYFSNPTMCSFEGLFIKLTVILLFLTYVFAALALYNAYKENIKGDKLAVVAVAIPSVVSLIIFGFVWWMILSALFVFIIASPFFFNYLFPSSEKRIMLKKVDKVAVVSFVCSVLSVFSLFFSIRFLSFSGKMLAAFCLLNAYFALILANFSLTFNKLKSLSGKIFAVISISLVGLFFSSSAWMWLVFRK